MDASVALAAGYLRMSGYFVLTELPVQVADRGDRFRAATDLDLLAIRLPHGGESLPRSGSSSLDVLLGSDDLLDLRDGVADILVGEVKRGRVGLNAGIREPRVLRFALRRTGCCPPDALEANAERLAERGAIETVGHMGHPCRVRLVAFGGRVAEAIHPRQTLVIELAHCAAFIRRRLDAHREVLRGAYFADPAINLLGLLYELEPMTPVTRGRD